MKLSTKYWLFQALGWGAYSVVGLFFTTRYVGGLVATLRGGRSVEISRRQSARLRELLSL